MDAISHLKQRADYTHKHNIQSGRHGWLRLTPAYSVKIVEEILSRHDAAKRVLDPFCGSGTTALCSARRGVKSTTTDINPFLIWLTGIKTRDYEAREIAAAREAGELVLGRMGREWPSAEAPAIHKIERWWSDVSLKFLCDLKGAIDGAEIPAVSRDLLLTAFCRTLIQISSASFNHQSMSFKDEKFESDIETYRHFFRDNLVRILAGCEEEIRAEAAIRLQDARALNRDVLGAFDLVITSPPYANRMSYIRELRPYMYWLGHLAEARDAGELDWKAIGGTWGVATSRLGAWNTARNYSNEHLSLVVAEISGSKGRHANTLSRYVHKYCEDIFEHLSSLAGVMNDGAKIHYIVGNSTFYGTLVRIEDLYADMMRKAGFSEIEIKPIRKRNSKKELVEFDVSATWRQSGSCCA